jgi:hypothetical protein
MQFPVDQQNSSTTNIIHNLLRDEQKHEPGLNAKMCPSVNLRTELPIDLSPFLSSKGLTTQLRIFAIQIRVRKVHYQITSKDFVSRSTAEDLSKTAFLTVF